MEYLDITDSEDLWSQMMQYDNGDGVQYIDIDKYDNISDDVIKYINDLQIGMMELTHNGIDNLDLKDDNIGRKTNGDWAIFDMSESKRGYW